MVRGVKNPAYLARILLNTEVNWPRFDPDNTRGPPLEITRRLEDVFDDLPHVLFFPDDPEEMKRVYGDDAERIEGEFQTLCQALRALKTTGRIDRAVLHENEQRLNGMIAWVSKEEENALARIDPNHSDVIEDAKRISFRISLEDAISEVSCFNYYSYLAFNCASNVLKIMQDGLIQIGESLSQGPPSQPSP